LSNLYKLYPFKEGYRFTNATGDEYYAYFTSFELQTPYHTTIETVSFGFECKRTDLQAKQVYDESTKKTIIHLIEDYFRLNGDNALLYICLNSDEMARHRSVIFGKWFNEFGDGYERYKSDIKTEKLNFYSSVIVKESNPNKTKLVEAFNFTIDYWFPESQ